MALVKGKNMIVSLGGSVVAASRECSISIERETIEIAGQSASSREYISGRYGFSLSASGLYAIASSGKVSSADLLTLLLAGTSVNVAYQIDDDFSTARKTIVCKAVISRLEISGSYQGRATYSIDMQGTGELTQTSSSLSWPSFRISINSKDDTASDYYKITYIETNNDTVSAFDPDEGWTNGFIKGTATAKLLDGSTVTVDIDKVVNTDDNVTYVKNDDGYFHDPNSKVLEGDLINYKVYAHYNGYEFTAIFTVEYS